MAAEVETVKALKELCRGWKFPEWMEHVPGYLFIKDLEGVYLALNVPIDSRGKTDLELPWKETAEQLRAHDAQVITSKKQMTFIEKGRFRGDKMITICAIKAPLFDKNGHVIGLIGHATEIDELGLSA